MEKLWELLSVGVFAGIGGWIGAYLKVKAENFATREDTNKIVEHLSAVTAATKGIEAKISDDVWDRQRRWELKRDVLFEAARAVSEAQAALMVQSIIVKTEQSHGKVSEPIWDQHKRDAHERLTQAANKLDSAILLVNIGCGDEVASAGRTLTACLSGIAAKMFKAGGSDVWNKSLEEMSQKTFAFRNAVRAELEIERPAAQALVSKPADPQQSA